MNTIKSITTKNISFIRSPDDTEFCISSQHVTEMNYDKLQQLIDSHAYHCPLRKAPISDILKEVL